MDYTSIVWFSLDPLPSKVRFANCTHFVLTPVEDVRHGARVVAEKWSAEVRLMPRNVLLVDNYFKLRLAFKVGEERHDRIVNNMRNVEEDFLMMCNQNNMDPLEAYEKVIGMFPHRMVSSEIFEPLERGSKPRKRTNR